MSEEENIDQTLNHLFRQEFGKMVSVLVKIFGTENLELAEDVVQDALVSALETWKYKGVPNNPRAWLYRTARNRAIDIIRRKKHSQAFDFSDPEHQLLTSEYTLAKTMEDFWQEGHIKDDYLGMMYACCTPELSAENQVTFILKSLCGFSTKEVAKAFVSSEDTISKRLYRTKEYFRKTKSKPQIPSADEIGPRTNTVLSAIYLMFNEGYNSTHSDDLIRDDLISQAMSLCKSLIDNNKVHQPEPYALMGLMCFHAARTESRLTTEGELILLSKQDRSKWNTELIAKGNEYLNLSAFGDSISPYHLEAAIAYEHCTAKSYADTNWTQILAHYDALLKLGFDPIVFLNRCLVILEVNGPNQAWDSLAELEDNKQLQGYYLYHAILGAIHQQLGRKSEAVESYEKALTLTQSKHEQNLLKEKIAVVWN